VKLRWSNTGSEYVRMQKDGDMGTCTYRVLGSIPTVGTKPRNVFIKYTPINRQRPK